MIILRTILEFLTTPSNFFFLLSVVAIFAMTMGRRRSAITFLSLSLLGFAGFGYTSLSEVMIAPLVARFSPVDLEKAEPPFGLIVLGGGMNEVHAVHNDALMDLGDGGEAVPIAVLLSQRYPDAKILLIDGAGPISAPRRPVDGMERVAREFGISSDRIMTGPNSTSTLERVSVAIDMIGDTRDQDWWVISPAHRLPRVIGTFRKLGFEPMPYPIDFEWVPPIDPTYRYALLDGLRLTDLGAHEWRGLLSYYLSGKIDALFPGP